MAMGQDEDPGKACLGERPNLCPFFQISERIKGRGEHQSFVVKSLRGA